MPPSSASHLRMCSSSQRLCRGRPVGIWPSRRRQQTADGQVPLLLIVRLMDETSGIGGESFFVDDRNEHNKALRRADSRIYGSVKSNVQKEDARALLEAIGVRRG